MRTIMVMFDSLNRRMLPNYGCDWVHAPNFKRLGEKAVTFDNNYVGSLPCMPARRDIQTGRYCFLHRSWGPMEPFDNSMPEILKNKGVYTHLVTDHYHYFEDGGSTFHSRYSSWDVVRGQEGDTWVGQVKDPEIPDHIPTMRQFTHPEWWKHNWLSREKTREEEKRPITLLFDKGLEFMEVNKNDDNWFLQLESFDPHEPFDASDRFKEYYNDTYDGKHFDWPPYAPVTESEEVVEHTRKEYAALLSMCDYNLGRVLDFMDENNMWNDTMLIVNTDHGFMLGEKDWWAKSVMPCYNELANTPFFVWDPRNKEASGQRRSALVQTIDIAPTILEFFGLDIPSEMQGKPLYNTIKNDSKIRDAAIFGFFGSFVNITDGRYVYMKASESIANKPLYEYTLLPTHQQGMFRPDELQEIEIIEAMPFTKGCMVMKIEAANKLHNATFCNSFQFGDYLWDLENDPEQTNPVDDLEIECRMTTLLLDLMAQSDAPKEQYKRLGLEFNGPVTPEDILNKRSQKTRFEDFPISQKYEWSQDARNIFIGMLSLMPEGKMEEYIDFVDNVLEQSGTGTAKKEHFNAVAKKYYSDSEDKNFYFLNKLTRIR